MLRKTHKRNFSSFKAPPPRLPTWWRASNVFIFKTTTQDIASEERVKMNFKERKNWNNKFWTISSCGMLVQHFPLLLQFPLALNLSHCLLFQHPTHMLLYSSAILSMKHSLLYIYIHFTIHTHKTIWMIFFLFSSILKCIWWSFYL